MDRRKFIKGLYLAGLSFLTPIDKISIAYDDFNYQPKETINHWSSLQPSDIVKDIEAAQIAMRQATNIMPNVIRMPKVMFDKLASANLTEETESQSIMEYITCKI